MSVDMTKTQTANAQDVNAAENLNEVPTVAPLVDIYENKDELLMFAGIPGVDADALNISLHDLDLVIEGKRLIPTYGTAEQETRTVGYRRSFVLPPGIDGNNIVAKITDGVLALHLPKAASAKPRQIPIKTA